MNWEQKLVLSVAGTVFIGYTLVDFFSDKTVADYKARCQQEQSGIVTPEARQEPGTQMLIAGHCACYSDLFLAKNGKVRMALLSSGLLGTSDFVSPDQEEKLECIKKSLEQVKLSEQKHN